MGFQAIASARHHTPSHRATTTDRILCDGLMRHNGRLAIRDAMDAYVTGCSLNVHSAVKSADAREIRSTAQIGTTAEV